MEQVFILMVLFQFKHFACDFLFQTTYMLRKDLPTWKFALPLSFHSGAHAFGTFVITILWCPLLWWLALFDFVLHFSMDRLKSGPRYLGRFNDPSTKAYWNVFGLDQMVHHLTHIAIIWMIAVSSAC